MTLMISYVGNNGALHSKEYREIFTDTDLVCHFLCVLISAGGLFIHEFFYCFLVSRRLTIADPNLLFGTILHGIHLILVFF